MSSITKKQIRDWLVSANGKAIRWIREHGDEDLEDLIIAACTKDLINTYNLFDSPAWYQAELIESCVDPQKYVKRVLARYAHDRSPERYRPLANLIEELTRRGHAPCKRFLQKRWRGELNRGNASLACSSLWLWRAPAYRRILHHIASLTVEKEHLAELLDQVHSEARFIFTEKFVNRIRTEMEILFPQLVQKGEPEALEPKEPYQNDFEEKRPSLEEIRITVSNYNSGPAFGWIREDNPQEMDSVAQLLDEDLTAGEAWSWLRIFTYEPYPGRIESLLRWIDIQETRNVALETLGQVRHPLARKAVLAWITSRSYYAYAIQAFKANWEPGDEGLLLRILKKHRKDNTGHYGFEAAIDVIEANPEGNWAEVLALGLEYVPCNHCRRRYAQALIDRKLLTPDQIEDLLLDGWIAIRYMAAHAKGLNPGKYRERF